MLLATRLRSLCPGLFLPTIRIVPGEVSVLSSAELLSHLFLGIHRGRFGQVHKCTEISTGLNLAAKIIKVKGAKEKVSTVLSPAPARGSTLPIPGYHKTLPSIGSSPSPAHH